MTPESPTALLHLHVGPFDLQRVIGAGGTATVYLAVRRGAEAAPAVALKLVHAHLKQTEPQVASELLEEAKLTARIRHPRVVSVLDFGEDAAGTYLVLEHVDGVPLADLLSTMPPPEASLGLSALSDALEGLHAAHELRDAQGELVGLVHRDFTPHNILVGADGLAKLSDFGIAKAQIRSNTTKQGFVKGKAAYMSPEQIRGKGIDRRCDIWAAGVVAWEILAGRRLYAADDINAMFRIVAEDPPLLRTVNPNVSAEVEAVVAKALSRNPTERFATAEELRRDLLAAWTATAPLATREDVAKAVRGALEARAAAAEATRKSAPAPRPAPSSGMKWKVAAAGLAVALIVAIAVALRPKPAPVTATPETHLPPGPLGAAPTPPAPIEPPPRADPKPVEVAPPTPTEPPPAPREAVAPKVRPQSVPPPKPPAETRPVAMEKEELPPPPRPGAAPLADNPYDKGP